MPSMSDAPSVVPAAATPVSAPSALVPVPDSLPEPELVVLPEATPDIEALFRFAREAELRVRALRLVVEERLVTARGDETRRHEVWLRHPGQARITTYRDAALPSRDYRIWLLDGGLVTTFEPARKVASRRPLQQHVVGIDRASLPAFARQGAALTALEPGSLADTFVHPHGLFRNVLLTGPLAVQGARIVGDREAILVRADHPRSSKVLVDRPDRWVEVGIDRQTGFLLLLLERIADVVTRHAEVVELVVDPVIPATAFELRLPTETRMLY
jgi:hypothetical protein